jgi:hypothetical protein
MNFKKLPHFVCEKGCDLGTSSTIPHIPPNGSHKGIKVKQAAEDILNIRNMTEAQMEA